MMEKQEDSMSTTTSNSSSEGHGDTYTAEATGGVERPSSASVSHPFVSSTTIQKGGGVNSQTTVGNRNVNPGYFVLSCTGRIESGKIFGINEIYCKYSIVYGDDWEFTSGMEEGISQITEKDSDGTYIWNFPLEITFKSSNPSGWPQIVICVYGSDFLGNHIARGYGSTHLPLSHGSFTKIVPLFVPESTSFLQRISSWLLGRRPEFINPKVLAQSEGRQIVRVNSGGLVRVKFEVVLKDISKLGFNTSSNIFQDKSEN